MCMISQLSLQDLSMYALNLIQFVSHRTQNIVLTNYGLYTANINYAHDLKMAEIYIRPGYFNWEDAAAQFDESVLLSCPNRIQQMRSQTTTVYDKQKKKRALY